MALCDKYGDGRVEAVCQSALSFDVIDVRRIGRMLKLAISKPPASGGNVVQLPLPAPRFARDEEHFRTRRDAKGDKEAT